MKLSIIVKPNSRQNLVTKNANDSYTVKLTALAKEGKANKLLIKLLSAHFKVSKSKILILSGEKSKRKIVEII